MENIKPEDVMRALDILYKMDFFQGQRAGRELWFEKPFEVQEQDIADFSQGIEFVKNLIANAIALLREKDARIEQLLGDIRATVELANKGAAEKDAEIDRLIKERDDARRDCAIAEQNHYECKKELEEMSDDILNSVRAERDRYKAEIEQYQSALLKRCAEHEYDYSRGWNEAITKFVQRLKAEAVEVDVSMGYGNECWQKAVTEWEIDRVVEELKGEENG